MRDVEDCSLDEQMPSFFLSETLKYLYLLFDEVGFYFPVFVICLPARVCPALVPVSSWGVESADTPIPVNSLVPLGRLFFAPGQLPPQGQLRLLNGGAPFLS